MRWEWKDDIASLIVPLALAIVALCVFAAPAKADGPTQARGVFCDTMHEVETYVTLAGTGTPAREAFESVNAAAGKPHACVFGHVVFETFEEVKDITISEHQLTIVKPAIISAHTPMVFMPIEMTQFMVVERRLMYPPRLGA